MVEEQKPTEETKIAQETTDNKENVTTQAPETKTEESQEQINWRKMRENREIERRELAAEKKRLADAEAQAQALKQAMESLLNKSPLQPQQEYYQHEETDDERIQKKVDEAINQRERQYQEERRKIELQEYPQKLINTYQDFNNVCSEENLDYLEFHYPEIANAFKHTPEGFDKWASIYQTVKKLVPNTNGKKEQHKAEKNMQKPQSMSLPGVASTGDMAPYKLDDKRRADNWNRMQKARKGIR